MSLRERSRVQLEGEGKRDAAEMAEAKACGEVLVAKRQEVPEASAEGSLAGQQLPLPVKQVFMGCPWGPGCQLKGRHKPHMLSRNLRKTSALMRQERGKGLPGLRSQTADVREVRPICRISETRALGARPV